ncbi:hypothetical protein C4A33_03450 [Escherichia coli]|jgi:hypothetical protein|nr:hypothetical protein C4A47_01775 [Escherichia coli]RDQ00061.1 hypothetical protein C4A42_03394 [Escherichia coli]RDQ13383.1 hypothetical protein C4A38_03429 [Escherichia coli]RDQ33755.1 hypothetical protein C4A40_03419 [Escherichia coli]RDQ42181.1 hypothetical protein C4A33_03450 [Escherichia coli]
MFFYFLCVCGGGSTQRIVFSADIVAPVCYVVLDADKTSVVTYQ